MSNEASSVALVERVVRGGIPDPIRAERALRATLAVLGERLTADEAGALAQELPPELAYVVTCGAYDGDFDAGELYERVRAREDARPAVGREDVDVVLRAIGEIASEDVRRKLRRALPASIAERLVGEAHGEIPPYATARRSAPPATTLASGRTGSRHPLSESAPPSGQSGSVAQGGDPHGETKLSSSRGLTQERFAETLATGQPPGPTRPLGGRG